MATNGIISITKDDKVIFKCVVGCDGMNAEKTAKKIKLLKNPTIDQIYDVCKANDFGCISCLVVQGENGTFKADYDSEYRPHEDSKLDKLYVDKFSDPNFNPRWIYGTASHVEIVKL